MPAAGSEAAPLAVRVVLLVLLVAFGAAVGSVGALGWRGRLTRAGRVGVRTPRALRGDDAFRLANRVAGLPALVAGVVAILGGVAAYALPTTLGTALAAGFGLVGAVLIARAGAVLGDRAAATVPVAAETKAVPPGCAGCACGGCAALTRG